MKQATARFALAFLGLLFIPFIYNSCQGHMLGGSLTPASSTCKMALENGRAVNLAESVKHPSPFLKGKVRLHNAAAAIPVTPPNVTQGTKLGAIIDNRCMQNKAQDEIASTVITKVAHHSGELNAQLEHQIYLWPLDRDYSEDEINSIADKENCIVGVSWNKEYKIQSMFNDPYYVTSQMQLQTLHAEAAYSKFYSAVGAMALTGSPVILAAIDTGIDYTHPDLAGNIYPNSMGAGIDITTLGTNSVSYNPQDVSPYGHGTHVSGIMAAIANNDAGIVGTMPYRAKLMPIKVFQSDGNGNVTTTSQFFFNGLQYAYLNNANVINISLGSVTTGVDTDALAEQGLTEVVQHGLVAVVVIGNADSGNGQLVDGKTVSSIPGQYATIPGVIGVGAIDSLTLTKSYFSNYSTTYAEIGAPGEISSGAGIYSTLPGASYGTLAGTSQAAPAVSAAAGLTIGLIREAYGMIPSPAEVERLILQSAIKNPALTSYFTNGNQLDLLSLVQTINAEYPRTAGGTDNRSSGCH